MGLFTGEEGTELLSSSSSSVAQLLAFVNWSAMCGHLAPTLREHDVPHFPGAMGAVSVLMC
jgi:hypothetical protein